MHALFSKKILLTLLAFSAVLYSNESFAMKRAEEKEALASPNARKKGKPGNQNQVNYVSKPSSNQTVQNIYLSGAIPYFSRFLTDKDRGRLASVSRFCNAALFKRNPNPWPALSLLVKLNTDDKGLFNCSYPIPVSMVSVTLDDDSRVEQIAAFFDWMAKSPPKHLAIFYNAPTDRHREAEESQKLAAFGMALFMKRKELNPIRSLSLSGFYNTGDYSSGQEKDTLSVISMGISALFPYIEELVVDDSSFFDRNDWQTTGFADNLRRLKSVTISSHTPTSHFRDLEQYFKPTVEHVCLENLEIDRDFFMEGDFDWEESTHRVHTLFREMPNLKSMTLRHLTFVEVNTANQVPCTEPELKEFLNFLMGLKHLESLEIEGGNWVTDATREGATINFRHNLQKVPNLELNW